MAQAIAATVPHETAARKLAEWLAKMVHRVQVAKTGDQWSIFVPEAALHRARRALAEVMVAANPAKGRECCQKLGKGAPCARCGKHAHFTVGWIIPRRTPDERPACSSACAAALLRQPARSNPGRRPRLRRFEADHSVMSQVGHLVQDGRLEEAADIIEQHTGRRPAPGTLRAKYSGMTLGGEPGSITYRNPAHGKGDWYVVELGFHGKTGKLVKFLKAGPFPSRAEALKYGRRMQYPFTTQRGRRGTVRERDFIDMKGARFNPNDKRYNVWAYNRLTGGSFELERNVDAKTAVRAYREARKQGLRPWCIDLTTRNEVHPTRSGALPNPARAHRWKGGTDAYGQGMRSGTGYVRFWLWNDREWKINLRMSYEGVHGEPSLRESAKHYASEEADKKRIAQRFGNQAGMWKAGFILGFEKAIAAYFGQKRRFSESRGRDLEPYEERQMARERHARRHPVRRNPTARAAWEKMTGRQRLHTLMAAGIDYEVAEMRGNKRWDLLPSVWRGLIERIWENRGSSRGTTKRMARATSNPSKKVREARVAKVKMLLVRIKAILQAGEQHVRMGRRKEALESSRRADALWDQMPKGVAMVSPQTRREAYELSQRGIRLRNGQVLFNGRRVRRNAAGQYLIQAIRPKHRNWVTIDVKDDLNRALLNALQRARLGNVTYRVWDTESVSEVWRGSGKDATIEGWKTARPSGLVGANRRRHHAP